METLVNFLSSLDMGRLSGIIALASIAVTAFAMHVLHSHLNRGNDNEQKK